MPVGFSVRPPNPLTVLKVWTREFTSRRSLRLHAQVTTARRWAENDIMLQ
jgi:hypothetical protein